MLDAGPRPLLGEAHHDRGPVLLAWDQVRSAARHRGRGRNVVWHEFAHKIDMLDGVVDGTPLMQDREALDRWVEVCAAELELLRSGEGGHLIDPYAATDPGEFFAVTTEVFFDLPLELRAEKPELYEVLAASTGRTPPVASRRGHHRTICEPQLGRQHRLRRRRVSSCRLRSRSCSRSSPRPTRFVRSAVVIRSI